MGNPMPESEWLQIVSELATPIDFDALIARRILKRRSKYAYVVLQPKKVPAHVWRQARTVTTLEVKGKTTTTITVKDNTKVMHGMLVKAVGVRRAQELVQQVATRGVVPVP